MIDRGCDPSPVRSRKIPRPLSVLPFICILIVAPCPDGICLRQTRCCKIRRPRLDAKGAKQQERPFGRSCCFALVPCWNIYAAFEESILTSSPWMVM